MDVSNKALLEAIIRQNETILKLELNIMNISTTLSSVYVSGFKRVDEKVREIVNTQVRDANKSLRILHEELKDLNEFLKNEL